MIITVRDVVDAVRSKYGMTREQFFLVEAKRKISRPRQIAMMLAREYTGVSYPRLGTSFCRHHTTVFHAVRQIKKLCQEDPVLAAEVEGCRELLAHLTPWKAAVAKEQIAA